MKIEFDENYGFGLYDSYSTLTSFTLDSDFEAESFYKNNSKVISLLMYEAAVKLFENDFLEVPVCRLHFYDGRRATLSISRDNIDTILNKCLKTFEGLEEYEKCSKIVKMLKIE